MKLILGSLLAGLAIFIYGFVSFGVLKWHHPKSLKTDAAVVEAVKAAAPEPGMYLIPSQLRADGSHRSEAEWMQASAEGPFVLAMIRPGANRRPMVSYMTAAFTYAVIQALLLGLILRRARLGYGPTVALGALIGLFVAASSWLPASNWYEYPVGYWAPYVVDYVVQGVLASAILGKFVLAPRGSNAS